MNIKINIVNDLFAIRKFWLSINMIYRSSNRFIKLKTLKIPYKHTPTIPMVKTSSMFQIYGECFLFNWSFRSSNWESKTIEGVFLGRRKNSSSHSMQQHQPSTPYQTSASSFTSSTRAPVSPTLAPTPWMELTTISRKAELSAPYFTLDSKLKKIDTAWEHLWTLRRFNEIDLCPTGSFLCPTSVGLGCWCFELGSVPPSNIPH